MRQTVLIAVVATLLIGTIVEVIAGGQVSRGQTSFLLRSARQRHWHSSAHRHEEFSDRGAAAVTAL
jgi:hypothetical protein